MFSKGSWGGDIDKKPERSDRASYGNIWEKPAPGRIAV